MPLHEDTGEQEQEAIAELIGLAGLHLEGLPRGSPTSIVITAMLARLEGHGCQRWGAGWYAELRLDSAVSGVFHLRDSAGKLSASVGQTTTAPSTPARSAKRSRSR